MRRARVCHYCHCDIWNILKLKCSTLLIKKKQTEQMLVHTPSTNRATLIPRWVCWSPCHRWHKCLWLLRAECHRTLLNVGTNEIKIVATYCQHCRNGIKMQICLNYEMNSIYKETFRKATKLNTLDELKTNRKGIRRQCHPKTYTHWISNDFSISNDANMLLD